jgi:RNA polymerase sigma-70 factor (ECF subfamily)
VTRYTAIDRLRKEKQHRRTENLDRAVQLSSDTPIDPSFQDAQQLRAMLLTLPSEQRQLIELAFFMGMTHMQMAEQLNLPLGTVKTRLRSGLKKLRSLWEAANNQNEDFRS